jgi:hypothetical protein
MRSGWSQVGAAGALVFGFALSSCGGSAVNGSVAGLELPSIEDGFYTQFENDDDTYYAVVLTDFPDACNVFNAAEPSLGSQYSVLQLWITAPDPQDYPVYASSHLDEAGSTYAVSWFTVVINSTDVLNTDGVAGVVQITDYQYEDRVLSGNMDLIFSGNGNRLQGGFSVPYCEVDWKKGSKLLLE